MRFKNVTLGWFYCGSFYCLRKKWARLILSETKHSNVQQNDHFYYIVDKNELLQVVFYR